MWYLEKEYDYYYFYKVSYSKKSFYEDFIKESIKVLNSFKYNLTTMI